MINFDILHTRLVTYNTTSENILLESLFSYDESDTHKARIIRALVTWLESASTEWLIRFVRCITGQAGVIRGRAMLVYVLYES
jgi:hypothetical protein